MNRKVQLTKLLQTQNWEIIIIGGGACGLGTAVDSTTRGLNTVFAGLRPLAAPEEKGQSTKEVSSHKIIVSETGLITIKGGKCTTYRKIAEDIINKAIAFHQLPKTACKTKQLLIHGNKITTLYIYGSDISEI